jgi:hypothetical protein
MRSLTIEDLLRMLKLLSVDCDDERSKNVVHDFTDILHSLQVLMRTIPSEFEPTSYFRLLLESAED